MTNSIEQLTHKLQKLKKQYTEETTFDANELQALKLNNRAFVRSVQEFKHASLALLVSGICKYLFEGWTPNVQLPAGKNPSGWFYVYLNKPQAVLDQEHAESDRKIEEDYHASLKRDQTQLIEEITRVTLDLQHAKEFEKSEARKQREFNKTLEEVKSELSIDDIAEVDNG